MSELDSAALAKKLRLKPKSVKTLNEIISSPKISQLEAYLKHHKTTNRKVARTEASELMAKPSAKVYLDAHAALAKTNIVHMAVKAKNESVRLKANQDILDRNEGKPTIKTESTTQNLNVNIEASDELKAQFTEFLKQKTQK